MKLYFSKGACSIAIRITMYELGINSDFESVDLKTKKTQSGQNFLQINPKGSVPTLITDKNETITENVAIQQYLADTYQATSLLPAVNDINRYRVIEWLSYVGSDLHKTCGAFFNPNIPADLKASVYFPLLTGKLDYVDQHLQHNRFLAGNHFTLADSYMFVILLWLPYFKIDVTKWPNLNRYSLELTKRESITRALTDEGLLQTTQA